MISTGQILAAAFVTGIAVGLTAAALRWPVVAALAAAASSFALIVVWRAVSNLAGLNGDYVPAVSVGDTVCLVAGGLGPAAVACLPVGRSTGRRWLPAAVGAVAGFVINVTIL